MSSSEICLATCEGEGADKVCTFKFSFDPFASETGYFRVDGCDGIMPVLGMEENVKYVFDQSDSSNWYHPIGVGYYPDGALDDKPELEPEEVPPGADSCNGTCQFPQYQVDGTDLCSTDPCEEGDFGLDEYEGVFFSGKREVWQERGKFSFHLTITDEGTKEFFYFCHIHHKMSGRIKVLDSEGNAKAPTDEIPIPYEYYIPDEFDAECGTHNVTHFQNQEGCPDMTFLCGDVDDGFGKCMVALDCAMHVEMRVENDPSPTALFMRQMIGHHRNAVNMAKALMKTEGEAISQDPDVEDLLWDIVNTQNAQITVMRAWLDGNTLPEYAACPHVSEGAVITSKEEDKNVGLIVVTVIAVLLALVSLFTAFRSSKRAKAAEAKARQAPVKGSTNNNEAPGGSVSRV
eukprot:CAMPEP_0184511232 /NCGR_PEP_ID=MMETSP0198_2-20121128/2241_1 /TAXON_ID=1112570 /ORGANISM="Thraustochytrium sp., Strain LLF1b" /LENGTH=402 /DNA_ID=CAMNT_0026901183 /DNA_START=170 /DNA_END=1378 /DNA_ORIENTATION=-